MTDKQQPEALRQAAWLKKEGASCQRHYDLGVLIERQHGELEALRAKLKTHEDLGDAGSDVQLLRMGYAAARLEIESLKAQLHAAKQINAAQFGLLAASIPGSALSASHGQAPAETGNSVSAQTDSAPSRFGSPELQAMIIARCVEKDQADSVQEDAARLDFLIEQRAYVVSDPDACPGYWLHWARPDGSTWVQCDEHPTPRAAIDAARKQEANHDQ